MANPNLLSLLADGDDDEESEHFLEIQQMLRGGGSGEVPPVGAPRAAQAPSGLQAGHASQGLPSQAAQLRGAPGGHVAAHAQTPAAKAKAGALHLQIMLEWCKHNLSHAENVNVHNVIKEIKAKVAQGMKPPKDVYGSILGLIGPERVKVMKVFMAQEIQRRTPEQLGAGGGGRPAGNPGPAGRPQPAGQAPAPARPQPHQQQHPQQGHPAASGGSIMQSLMYVNAEQARHGPAVPQPRPGVSQPPHAQPMPMQQHWQAAAAQRATPPPGMPGYAPPPQQQQHPGYAQQQPRPAVLQGAHPAAGGARPAAAPAAAAAASSAALGKHPAEAAPSQPGPKRARKDKEDAEDENDVLKDSGINLEEEESALLATLERARASPAQQQQPQAAAAPEQPFLNAAPLSVKVLDVAKRHGMESVEAQVGQLLGRAADVHLGALIERVFAMTRQRTDAERARPGMVQSSNLRRRLHEWNQQEQQRQAAPPQPDADSQATVSRAPAAEEEAGKKGERSSRKETEKQQATAANAAAAAAFGGKAQKWGNWSTDAAKKPGGGGGKAGKAAASRPATPQPASGAPGPASEALTPAAASAARAPALPPTRVRAEAMSAKLEDLVAALERDPMYQRSTLLYKLYGQLSG